MTAGKLSLNTSNIAPCSSREVLKKKGIYSVQENQSYCFFYVSKYCRSFRRRISSGSLNDKQWQILKRNDTGISSNFICCEVDRHDEKEHSSAPTASPPLTLEAAVMSSSALCSPALSVCDRQKLKPLQMTSCTVKLHGRKLLGLRKSGWPFCKQCLMWTGVSQGHNSAWPSRVSETTSGEIYT